MPDYRSLLEAMEAACVKAGRLAQEMRAQMKWEIKPDGSIVTEADKAVESDLRALISQITPGAGVWGEEFGYTPPNEHGFWMLDPVDGTSNFAFGQPLWGVTAAYFQESALQLGVIRLPDLDWTLSALRGGGVTFNGSPAPPLAPGEIRAFDLVGHGDVLAPSQFGFPGKIRHIGSFVVESALFVTGGLRAVVSDKVCLYDAAAGIVMAREVGGEVRDLTGEDFDECEWTEPSKCRPFGFFPPGSNWPFQSQ